MGLKKEAEMRLGERVELVDVRLGASIDKEGTLSLASDVRGVSERGGASVRSILDGENEVVGGSVVGRMEIAWRRQGKRKLSE